MLVLLASLPTNVDRNPTPTPPAAMKGSKVPKYFPGNIQLYKEAAVTNNSLNEDESNPTISLSTYRQILKQLTVRACTCMCVFLCCLIDRITLHQIHYSDL